MKKHSLWLCPLAIAAIVALDQWVKVYIVTHFAVGESAEFLPRLLRLHYVRNFGAAWSSFSGERWLLIGVTGVGMLALAWLLARIVRHPLGVWSLTAVIGGGVRADDAGAYYVPIGALCALPEGLSMTDAQAETLALAPADAEWVLVYPNDDSEVPQP